MELGRLTEDLTAGILSRLSPHDIAAFSSTCRPTRALASAGRDSLFSSLCARRWHRPRDPAALGRTPRGLYTSANGWRAPALDAWAFEPDDGVVAHAIWLPAGGDGSDDLMAIATGKDLQLWELAEAGAPPGGRLAGSCPLQHPQVPVYCMAASGAAGGGWRLLVGDRQGRIMVMRAGRDSSSGGAAGAGNSAVGLHHLAELRDERGGGRGPVTEILLMGAESGSRQEQQQQQQHVACLHNGTSALQGQGQDDGNCIVVWDVEEGRQIRRPVKDPMSPATKLVATCRPDPAGGPYTLVAAGFEGCCPGCSAWGYPSLCYHKPPVRSAILCVVDTRCPEGVTERYSAMHRSIYPAIRAARGHYLFTSHANTPLAVWDLRRMGGGPLYQEEQLEWCAEDWDSSDSLDEDGSPWDHEEEAEDGRPQDLGDRGPDDARAGEDLGSAAAVGDVEGGQAAQRRSDVDLYARDAPAPAPAAPCQTGGMAAESAAAMSAASHHALWLEAGDDTLLGRDELGTVWSWDLSATLGWAEETGGGASSLGGGGASGSACPRGGWLELDGEAWRVPERRGCRPVPVASFPCLQDPMSGMVFPGVPSCEFACLCAKPGAPGRERLVITRVASVFRV